MGVFAALDEEAEGPPKNMGLMDVMAMSGHGMRGIEFKQLIVRRKKNDIIITVPTAEYEPKDALCFGQA